MGWMEWDDTATKPRIWEELAGYIKVSWSFPSWVKGGIGILVKRNH